jgi:hypothetical protein
MPSQNTGHCGRAIGRPERVLAELLKPVVLFGQHIHRFEPFLADVEAVDVEAADDGPAQERRQRDPSGLDTVVVPARDDGFKEVFLGQIVGIKSAFTHR